MHLDFTDVERQALMDAINTQVSVLKEFSNRIPLAQLIDTVQALESARMKLVRAGL
jgi:hypothetical protein